MIVIDERLLIIFTFLCIFIVEVEVILTLILFNPIFIYYLLSISCFNLTTLYYDHHIIIINAKFIVFCDVSFNFIFIVLHFKIENE